MWIESFGKDAFVGPVIKKPFLLWAPPAEKVRNKANKESSECAEIEGFVVQRLAVIISSTKGTRDLSVKLWQGYPLHVDDCFRSSQPPQRDARLRDDASKSAPRCNVCLRFSIHLPMTRVLAFIIVWKRCSKDLDNLSKTSKICILF